METTYHVFLGGQDQEMSEIEKVALNDSRCIVHNAGLDWGAKASDYQEDIESILMNHSLNDSPQAVYDGMRGIDIAPRKVKYVFVELEIDKKFTERITHFLGKSMSPLVIDHHGAAAGNNPAIIQFLNLLGIEPTRRQNLIGAMDAAWVPGLEALRATKSEIAEFLGTVGEMLVEAESVESIISQSSREAVDNCERLGSLIVVRCAHSRCAPITARLHGAQQVQNILIISDDGELNYFGPGEKVRAIAGKIEGGWSGGAGLCTPTAESFNFWTQYGGTVPDNAFWGINNTPDAAGDIIAIVK